MTIQVYIETLLRHMGIEDTEVVIENEEVEEGVEEPVKIFIKVPEDDMGMVVGRKAEGLIALQRVISVTFQPTLLRRRVVVEVNDYRERREASLQQMADEYAEKARRSGRPIRFPSLSSEDRKMIHMMFRDSDEFETESEGEGYDRRLVLYLKSEAQEDEQGDQDNQVTQKESQVEESQEVVEGEEE